MKSFRIVIVGGGIIGAAVFHRLSRVFGAGVLMIDKADQDSGATAFSGGILRAFHLDQLLSDRCAYGLRFYRELANSVPGKLNVVRTGFLQLIDATHHDQALDAYLSLAPQVELEWMTPGEAGNRFGLASTNGLSAAVFEPEAGYVDPLALARTLTDIGRESGGVAMSRVDLREIVTARSGEATGVATSVGTIECQTVIFCTGAWTPGLARRIALSPPVELRSKAIQVNVVARDATPHSLPAFVDLSNDAYGRPNGATAALVGCPVEEWDIDPDRLDAPSRLVCEDAIARATQRFDWAANCTVTGGYKRHDAYEDSGRGIVDWSQHIPGVLLASGFSGNGVKLAPATAAAVHSFVESASLSKPRGLH